MFECKCSNSGCGYVARCANADEAAAWTWHHELIAHDVMPDLTAVLDRTSVVRGGYETGFPGTPSAERFIPAKRREQLGKAPLPAMAAGG